MGLPKGTIQCQFIACIETVQTGKVNKMSSSITYTELKNSAFIEKCSDMIEFFGFYELVRVNFDSKNTKLALPSDYLSSECILPKNFLKWAERIHNFHIRSDDIWVTSFPKAGTTWIMNIIRQLKCGLDFTADYVDSEYMYFEKPIFYVITETNKKNDAYRALVEELKNLFDGYDNETSPRLLKSHLPAFLLPKDIWTVKPKVIYVYRDAKDVAISMFHMYKSKTGVKFSGTKEEFFDIFLENDIFFGPFNDHVNSFLQLKNLDHVLLIKYEDMVANPLAGVKEISAFLNYAYTGDQLKQLTEHVSFENMRRKNVVDRKMYPDGFKYVSFPSKLSR